MLKNVMSGTKLVPVVEIFKSIEGEGIRQGYPTVFVRFAGCNLRCSWCDTSYSHKTSDGKLMNYEAIVAEIMRHNCKRITFTGGEPLHEKDFINWFMQKFPGYEINIETNGSMDITDVVEKQSVIVTMDYKCPSSGMTEKMNLKNLKSLCYSDVLKFVVADNKDLEEMRRVLIEYKPRCHIFVHPVFGSIDLKELAQFIIDNDFLNMRMGIQIHKIIWDPQTRGV